MKWSEFVDKSGNVSRINWGGVYAITRARIRAKQMLTHSSIKKTIAFKPKGIANDGWIAQWDGPTIHRLETEWKTVNAETDRMALEWFEKNWKDAYNSLPVLINRLHRYRDETLKMNSDYWKLSNQAWKTTMINVEKAVDKGECGKQISEFIRNSSANIVVGGAVLLSGGTAVALLGVGSVGKGIFKYQDTGKVGSAVLEGSTEFIFGLIPLGAAGEIGDKALKEAMKGTVRIAGKEVQNQTVLAIIGAGIDGQVEVAKAVLEGKSLQEAALAGLGKLTGPVLGKYIEKIPFEKLGFPGRAILKIGAGNRQMTEEIVKAPIRVTRDKMVGAQAAKIVGAQASADFKNLAKSKRMKSLVSAAVPDKLAVDRFVQRLPKCSIPKGKGARSYPYP